MKRYLLVVAAFIAFSFFGAPLWAQGNNADVALGLTPYQSFHGGDIDAVNLTNGNLFVKIPLISYPQRGGKLNLGFSFVANGKDAQIKQICPPKLACYYYWSVGPAANALLGIVQDQFAQQLETWVPASNGIPGYYVFGVEAADSSTHPMVIATTGTYRSTDGTSYLVNETQQSLSTTVLDRHGISYLSYYPASSGVIREDSNGNQISGSSTNYTDTLGRNIPVPPSGTTSNTSGCPTGPLPVTIQLAWTPPGPSGGTSPFKICYVSVPISIPASSIGRATVNGYSGSRNMVQSIVLPNGTAWTFQYNDSDPGGPSGENYGSLTQITLPTGGTISYTYFSGVNCGPSYSLTRWIQTRIVDANDGTGPHTWTYFGGTSKNIVTDPVGNDTVHTITNLGFCTPYETLTQSYEGSSSGGTLLKTVQTDYTTTTNGDAQYYGMGSNVYPIRVTTTWPNGKVTKNETDYDTWPSSTVSYGNVIAHREYDYGTGSPGPLLRTTTTNYQYAAHSSYFTYNLISLPSSVKITDGGGAQRAYTFYLYDQYALGSSGIGSSQQHDTNPPDGTYRGNQTSVDRWLNGSTVATTKCNISVSNGYLVSYATFYDTGTVNTAVDSCGSSATDTTHMTTYAYSGTYVGAYPTTITNPLSQQTNHTYDFNTGLLASTTDANSQTTSFTYDNMWRIASVTYPDGGSATITHQESTFPFSATLTKKITPTSNYVTTNLFDGLGRISQSQLTSDPQGTVYTVTTYDADGRKATVTNPYRTTGDPTYGVTSYVYDGIGRTCVVVPPDGTASGPVCPTTQPSNDVFTTYAGNTTTVTDQQLKSRTSQTDGLGRLTNAWEDPNGLNYQTVYTYDALDDLLTVAQSSSRNRTFVYDSLKHLTSSTNPEAGTVTYAYDADSNVITKADARNITITYSYDVLNRMTGRTYSNGDPSVGYTYDQSTCIGTSPCYNVGRRTSMTDAGGSESFSYDKMGREWGEQRTTNSVTKATSYTYNLDGSLASLTYPSGRTITYAYNAAEQPTSATDTANSINYAIQGTYAPQGALAALTLGQAGSFAGIILSDSYNTRLQPNEFKASSSAGTAMDLTYSFVDSSNHNNGNAMGITNNRDTTRSQSFSYDSLNRIATAKTSSTSGSNCWGETYTIDQWSNLTAIGAVSGYTGCTQESLSVGATANNQLSATGFTYDAAGNMTGDSLNTYGFNAESEIKSAAGMGYRYDGDGNRVEKCTVNGSNCNVTKIYWYGAGTEILDESDASGNFTDEYVFFGGKRIAHRNVSSGSIYYYAEDFLGTSRSITTSTGTLCYDADFYPYGGERVVTNTCPQNYKFEGKERDTETGNDDFGARYYNSRLGRWLSADWSAIPAPVPVPYANLTNPQTLNLYAMVRDNPETFADLDGHDSIATLIGYQVNAMLQKDEAEQEAAYDYRNHDWVTVPTSGNTLTAEAEEQNLGGVKVDVSISAIETSAGNRGVEMQANPQGCGDCRWAQTTTRTGTDAHAATTDRADTRIVGVQPLYPTTERMNGFYDQPSTQKGGSGTFRATTTLGIADQKNKTFKVLGSMTWGYNLDKKGNVTVIAPRAATGGEQTRSINVLRRDSPLWTISGP